MQASGGAHARGGRHARRCPGDPPEAQHIASPPPSWLDPAGEGEHGESRARHPMRQGGGLNGQRDFPDDSWDNRGKRIYPGASPTRRCTPNTKLVVRSGSLGHPPRSCNSSLRRSGRPHPSAPRHCRAMAIGTPALGVMGHVVCQIPPHPAEQHGTSILSRCAQCPAITREQKRPARPHSGPPPLCHLGFGRAGSQ